MAKPSLIAATADLHLGNHGSGPLTAGLNERGLRAIQSFKNSLAEAKRREAGLYFVAGDLFHSRRPEPAVIHGVQQALAEGAGDMPVVIIPGNHDMLDASAENGNTACAPLYKEATIILEPTWVEVDAVPGMSFFCVPFQSKVSMTEYLSDLLPRYREAATKGQRVLICHVGVYGENAPPWCRTARDAINADDLLRAMEAGKFLQAFVGNFHKHERWKAGGVDGAAEIVQIGTLCPHGFGDEGVFPAVGGMAMYDGDDVEMVQIPGPRFLTLEDGSGVTQVPDNPNYFTVREPPAKKDKSDKPEVIQAADADSAFSEYVAGLTLPDGVSKDEVMAEVRATWKEAAAQ